MFFSYYNFSFLICNVIFTFLYSFLWRKKVLRH